MQMGSKRKLEQLISDKIDLKIKKIKRDKEGYYIMIKGSIQEEDITIVNIYVPNIGASQYIRQTLTDIKGEMDNNTIIVQTLTPHLHQWTDHQNRKLIRKHKKRKEIYENKPPKMKKIAIGTYISMIALNVMK